MAEQLAPRVGEPRRGPGTQPQRWTSRCAPVDAVVALLQQCEAAVALLQLAQPAVLALQPLDSAAGSQHQPQLLLAHCKLGSNVFP